MRYYRSKQGDTVDSIAWDVYGRQDGGLVESMIAANPGVEDYGPVLPAGLRLIIPDAPTPETTVGVRLWG